MIKPKVVTIVGTRPELIRLSRVIPHLDKVAEHTLIHTGQNSDPQLSDVFFRDLEIRKPDYFLGIDTATLASSLGETLIKVEPIFNHLKPDGVLILGDTNSSIAALLAKRMQITVYHLEAGNRSFDQNVPEEINRKLVDHVADFNLAYTEHARRNLLSEGIPSRNILVTGSPIKEIYNYYQSQIENSKVLEKLNLKPKGYFLVSAHRQENVDSPNRLNNLLETLKAVHDKWQLPILVSTHPRTKKNLEKLTSNSKIEGTEFHEPFGFLDFNKLQLNAFCVLSDSGTVSEESLILGFPAVTIRDSMERPEALDSGGIIMTGLHASDVIIGIEETVANSISKIKLPPEYLVEDFSRRTVRFIMSTIFKAKEWFGIRPLT